MTGKESEYIDVREPATLGAFLDAVCRRHGRKFRDFIFPEGNRLNPHIWLLVNKKKTTDLETVLKERESVVFSFPLMGG